MSTPLPDLGAGVVLEHCVTGRLREAYPVSERDVEVRAAGLAPAELTTTLERAVPAIEAADPLCRRIVFAAPEGDVSVLEAAEAAGFRYVVDVDLPEGPVSLAVAEPGWVTAVDMDLDRVPQT